MIVNVTVCLRRVEKVFEAIDCICMNIECTASKVKLMYKVIILSMAYSSLLLSSGIVSYNSHCFLFIKFLLDTLSLSVSLRLMGGEEMMLCSLCAVRQHLERTWLLRFWYEPLCSIGSVKREATKNMISCGFAVLSNYIVNHFAAIIR